MEITQEICEPVAIGPANRLTRCTVDNIDQDRALAPCFLNMEPMKVPSRVIPVDVSEVWPLSRPSDDVPNVVHHPRTSISNIGVRLDIRGTIRSNERQAYQYNECDSPANLVEPSHHR